MTYPGVCRGNDILFPVLSFSFWAGAGAVQWCRWAGGRGCAGRRVHDVPACAAAHNSGANLVPRFPSAPTVAHFLSLLPRLLDLTTSPSTPSRPSLRCPNPRAWAHLVSRQAHRQQRLPDGLLGAVADHHLIDPILQPILLPKLGADGLAQRRRAGVGRVAGVALPAGRAAGGDMFDSGEG